MGGKEQNCPVYISRIIPEGVAAKHGGLKRGDQLLWINGQPVDGESHDKGTFYFRINNQFFLIQFQFIDLSKLC